MKVLLLKKKAEMDINNPKVQEWEQLMWKYQKVLPIAKLGEKWVLMDKMIIKTRELNTIV